MITKFIKKTIYKLQLNDMAYCILKPFVKNTKYNFDIDEAYKLLNDVNPDKGGSCLKRRNIYVSYTYDVDIIVPVYNAEQYVEKCIESILAQKTKYKLRLIIIDDGSSDSSPQIVDKYQTEENVLIIHQENKGFSGARNTGLDLIESPYVMFVDSDDTIPDNAVQRLLECAYEKNADIVQGGYWTIDLDGNKTSTHAMSEGTVTEMHEHMLGQPWAKVFKSRLFSELSYPENYWYEDSLFSQIMYQIVDRVYGINVPVYNYRSNDMGISAKGRHNPKCIDTVWVTLHAFKDGEALGLKINKAYYLCMLRRIAISGRRVKKQPEKVQKAVFAVFADFIHRNFGEYLCTTSKYADLELALKCNRYKLYRLYCIFKRKGK